MIYKQSEINLHTHTFYCGHANGTPADMVRSAVETGKLKVIGISEHAPKKGVDILTGGKLDRMNYRDLRAYTDDVKELKEKTTDIKVLLGAECEWLDEAESFYRDEIKAELGYDYLIMGIHFVYDDMGKHYIGRFEGMRRFLKQYVDNYTTALASGLFKIGCHPDLFAPGFPVWDADAKAASKDIIQCAIDLNIPLELNDYGFRKPMINGRRPYSVDEFWETAAAFGVNICTNSDAHRPEDVYAKSSIEYAQQKGIKLVSWNVEGNEVNFVPAQ